MRDDLAVLRDYVPYFHKRLTGLRADGQSLEDIKSAFKVYSAKTKGDESDPDYLIDHTSAIFFVSEDGGVRNIFEGNTTVDEMVGSIL